jgi:hypothetical protein
MILGVETPDAFKILRFRMRGRLLELERPFLTRRYLGTTVSDSSTDLAEGNTDLTDKIVPYAFGSNANVPGILVNQFKGGGVWQFAGNAQNSIIMKDGGIPLTYAGDFGSLSSLVNAESLIAPGSYGTSLVNGIAMTRSPTTYGVTADLVEGVTASVRSAARIAQRILALTDTPSGDIATSSFDAFHAFNPAEVCLYVDTDSESALDMVTRVMDSVGGVLLDKIDGTFEAQWLTTPTGTPEADYTVRDMLDGVNVRMFAGPPGPTSDRDGIPAGIPAWSVAVTYGRVWKTMGAGDLAPVISEATDGTDLALKQYLSAAFRTATAQDEDVKTAYPQAVELTFDTTLVSQTDALAEAARRLALHKVRRDRIVMPTFMDRGEIELGRTVRLTVPRFGYGMGKNFVVLGNRVDFGKRTRALTLWG